MKFWPGPAITAFADGSYALIFANDGAGNNDLSTYIVSATGMKSAEIKIETSAANAVAPDAATLSNGNYVVAYQLDNATSDIEFSVRTSANGAVTTGTIANTAGQETRPEVAALTGGGFVAVWQDADGDGAGNAGLKARVYTGAGVALGAAFNVATTTAGVQEQADVAGLQDGGFLVAWRDATSQTLLGQRFSAAGAAIGHEFLVADVNNLSLPSLALLADGRVMVTATDEKNSNDNIINVIVDPRTSVTGTAGDDLLTSRLDGATVRGLAGSDKLFGFGGKDNLIGGDGADTLTGGSNRDILTGGTGRDVFDFNRATETGKTAATRDIIKDFAHNADDIDLSTIDANGAKAGDTFKWIGAAAFHHKAGELHYVKMNAAGMAHDKTIIEGDINGDGRADFQIELTGIKTLTAGDFIL